MVFTTQRQLIIAAGIGGVTLWTAASTIGFAVAVASANYYGQDAQRAKLALVDQTRRMKLAYEHLISAHDATLIAAMDNMAQTRANHFRATLRLVGVNPEAAGGGEGGPLIDGKDPKAIAAMLAAYRPVDTPMQQAAHDVSEMKRLASATAALPLSQPTNTTERSSGYGMRKDPFTGHAAFHPGLDFPAGVTTPVYSTAKGVISYAGDRSGYGNTVEIDHGHGFKTRFAHLSVITVHLGQQVTVHEKLGLIGSTGRSTGPHLHYEVWRDGRPQDPSRFLEAGEYVQQAG